MKTGARSINGKSQVVVLSFNRHRERDVTDHQLKCLMTMAMQTARDAIAITEPRSSALEAALSSLDIALKFEADHWLEGARKGGLPPIDESGHTPEIINSLQQRALAPLPPS